MEKEASLYFGLLQAIEKKELITNIEFDDSFKTVWFHAAGQKFVYNAWKMLDKDWLEGIYLIIAGGRIELLSDSEVKALYNDFVMV